MPVDPWESTRAFLRSAGVKFARGLAPSEIAGIESSLSVGFPPDLRAFLEGGLPKGRGWPNWRDVSSQKMAHSLSWPADGMCFDVRNRAFWLPEWGPRPDSDDEACEVAMAACESAPVLLPVFRHRYLPASPCLEGNPVLSVYQTDIIFYGPNLKEYFQAEFGAGWDSLDLSSVRRIPFWTDVMELD